MPFLRMLLGYLYIYTAKMFQKGYAVFLKTVQNLEENKHQFSAFESKQKSGIIAKKWIR